jgi:hypothetical protein
MTSLPVLESLVEKFSAILIFLTHSRNNCVLLDIPFYALHLAGEFDAVRAPDQLRKSAILIPGKEGHNTKF